MTSIAAVPSGIDELTPAWLTDVLHGTVTEVRPERIAQDTGFSALLYRLHLTGSGNIPSTVIAKLPAESEARGGMELLGGYQRELDFYRHIAPAAPLSTPHCHAARISGSDFILVLEDLCDWDDADHLAGLSPARLRAVLRSLAGLHAWSATAADGEVLQSFPLVDNPLTRELFLPAFAPGWQLYLDKTERPVPAAVADFAERFGDLAPQALVALTEREMLLHGDIRADNIFFRADAVKIVDFQLAVRGAGAADIAYLVSQGLATAVRSGADRDLVREYVDELKVLGVEDYSFDDAWRHYRFGVALLMYMPVVALLTWDVVPQRARQLCVTLVDRAVACIEEIGALEVFS
jgi:hypothetical protein